MINQRGYSLLEFAAVLPVLLGVILASVDLSNAFRSYTALQEGVRTATRCSYTTDGSCVNPSGINPTPIYDVYVWEPDPILFGFRHLYEGDEEYISRPTYVVDSFRADVLGSVDYSASEIQHFASAPLYELEAVQNVRVMKAMYPDMQILSPGNVNFRYKQQTGANYPHRVNKGISGVSGSAQSGQTNVDIGSATFTINPPSWWGETCHVSDNYDHNSGLHSSNGTSCYGNGSGLNLSKVPIVLWIKGEDQGSSNGAEGIVRISLNGQSLGGRQFAGSSAGGDASFVPRGAPANYSHSATPYTELTAYSPTRVDWGVENIIEFRLDFSSGNPGQQVSWGGTEIFVFIPQFGEGPDPFHPVSCHSSALLSQSTNPANCTNISPQPPLGIASVQSSGTITSYANPVSLGTNYHATASSTQSLFQQSPLATNPDYAQASFSTVPTGAIGSLSNSCPAGGNFGVPDPAVNGRVYNSALAQQICPPTNASNPFNVVWNEIPITIPGNPSANWSRLNCQENQIPAAKIPSVVTQYYKHDFGVPYYHGQSTDPEERIHTGPTVSPETHPHYIVTHDNRYNCPHLDPGGLGGSTVPGTFQPETFTYDKDFPNLPSESVFNGYQNELDCHWEDLVKTNAQSLGMSSSAYFVPIKVEPGIPYQMAALPSSGSCIEFKPGSSNVLGAHSTYLGQHQKGRFPVECYETGKSCTFTLAGFIGGDPSASGYTVDVTKAAEQFGYREILAANPRARFQCVGADCYELNLAQNGTDIVATGSVEVKMIMLGGQTITLRYADRETVEAELSTAKL